MSRRLLGNTVALTALSMNQSQYYSQVTVTNRSNVTTQSATYLATPVISAVTPTGSGNITYSYRVSALDANGETLASAPVTCQNGTLGGGNSNAIFWGSVTDATSYNVYGRTPNGEKLIVNIAFTSYADDGSVTPSGALPTTNTARDTVTNVTAAPVELWVRTDGITATLAAPDNFLVEPGATRTFPNATQQPAPGYTASTPISLISNSACPFEIELS